MQEFEIVRRLTENDGWRRLGYETIGTKEWHQAPITGTDIQSIVTEEQQKSTT